MPQTKAKPSVHHRPYTCRTPPWVIHFRTVWYKLLNRTRLPTYSRLRQSHRQLSQSVHRLVYRRWTSIRTDLRCQSKPAGTGPLPVVQSRATVIFTQSVQLSRAPTVPGALIMPTRGGTSRQCTGRTDFGPRTDIPGLTVPAGLPVCGWAYRSVPPWDIHVRLIITFMFHSVMASLDG